MNLCRGRSLWSQIELCGCESKGRDAGELLQRRKLGGDVFMANDEDIYMGVRVVILFRWKRGFILILGFKLRVKEMKLVHRDFDDATASAAIQNAAAPLLFFYSSLLPSQRFPSQS